MESGCPQTSSGEKKPLHDESLNPTCPEEWKVVCGTVPAPKQKHTANYPLIIPKEETVTYDTPQCAIPLVGTHTGAGTKNFVERSNTNKARVDNAFRAMKEIGFTVAMVKPVLKNLLKQFHKNWQPIELDNYRALADAIFEIKEAEKNEHSRKSVVSEDGSHSKKTVNSEKLLDEQAQEESTRPSNKRPHALKIRNPEMESGYPQTSSREKKSLHGGSLNPTCPKESKVVRGTVPAPKQKCAEYYPSSIPREEPFTYDTPQCAIPLVVTHPDSCEPQPQPQPSRGNRLNELLAWKKKQGEASASAAPATTSIPTEIVDQPPPAKKRKKSASSSKPTTPSLQSLQPAGTSTPAITLSEPSLYQQPRAKKGKSTLSRFEVELKPRDQEFSQQKLAEFDKFLHGIISEELIDKSVAHPAASHLFDHQRKMLMLALDHLNHYTQIVEQLEKDDEVPRLREDVEKLSTQVANLQKKLKEKSVALKKAQSDHKDDISQREQKENELRAKWSEEVTQIRKSRDNLQNEVWNLETSLLEARMKIEQLKRGEGLNFRVLVDSAPFAPVREAWDEMVLEDVRKAILKVYPNLDLAFLDNGVPENIEPRP